MFGPTVSPLLVQSGKGRIASDPPLLNLPRAKATKKRRRPTGSAAQFRGRQRPQIGTNGTRCQIDIVRPTEWDMQTIWSSAPPREAHALRAICTRSGPVFTRQAAGREWLSKKCKSHFSLTGIIPSGCSLWLRRFVERDDSHGIEGARRSRDNSDSGRRRAFRLARPDPRFVTTSTGRSR